MYFFIKFSGHVIHGERMTHIDSGGQKSKVKVTMDMYRNNIVNTTAIKL